MLIPCEKVPNKTKLELDKNVSNFSFAVYNSISAVNQSHWNAIAAYGSDFLQPNYLSVLEKTPPKNMRFYYSIIYDKAKPVAVTYFQVIDFSAESIESYIETDTEEFQCFFTKHIKKHITNHILRNADKINMRLLICGNACISGEHGFSALPDLNRKLLFDALADVISEISTTEKLRGKIAAVLVKDFYNNSLQYSKELEEFKFHDFLVEPNMIVDIEWKTIDDYLNAMSKKYRNRAKSVIKKGQLMERKVFSAADISANAAAVKTLYNNVHFKAKFRMATLSADYFVEMKKSMKDAFNFTAYYFENKLVGFRTSFIMKNNVEAHFIGIDYSLNKELEIYQNILYDYVKEAIDHHSTILFLGRTASEIKTTVGAKAHELRCYVRHRNPVSNRIIKPFLDYLKPTDWVPRNPFKEVEAE